MSRCLARNILLTAAEVNSWPCRVQLVLSTGSHSTASIDATKIYSDPCGCVLNDLLTKYYTHIEWRSNATQFHAVATMEARREGQLRTDISATCSSLIFGELVQRQASRREGSRKARYPGMPIRSSGAPAFLMLIA